MQEEEGEPNIDRSSTASTTGTSTRLHIEVCTILLYRVKVQPLEEELHIDWSSSDSTAGTSYHKMKNR